MAWGIIMRKCDILCPRCRESGVSGWSDPWVHCHHKPEAEYEDNDEAWKAGIELDGNYLEYIKSLITEVERLREAIEKHRLDMWGQETNEDVGHGIDAELYKALEEKKQEPPCP
jgi:hypothetical protein